jgi:hypothetical protein
MREVDCGGRLHCSQYLGDMTAGRQLAGYDRVLQRRQAVALARHFREANGLSIAQIAARLARSPATVKAYFYDPSDANKRPTDSPQERQFSTLLVMHGGRSASDSSALAATARGRRSRLPDLCGCGSLERRYSGLRYCP